MKEERPHDNEVISTGLGHMTYKEYRKLHAPEIPIDDDYRCERTNDLFEFEADKTVNDEGKSTINKFFKGFKSNLPKKDKDRDMDR